MLPPPSLLLWPGDKKKKLAESVVAGVSYDPPPSVKKALTAAMATGVTYEPELPAIVETCAGPDEPLPPPPPEKKEMAVGPDAG